MNLPRQPKRPPVGPMPTLAETRLGPRGIQKYPLPSREGTGGRVENQYSHPRLAPLRALGCKAALQLATGNKQTLLNLTPSTTKTQQKKPTSEKMSHWPASAGFVMPACKHKGGMKIIMQGPVPGIEQIRPCRAGAVRSPRGSQGELTLHFQRQDYFRDNYIRANALYNWPKKGGGEFLLRRLSPRPRTSSGHAAS
jgi:hypothetical protein